MPVEVPSYKVVAACLKMQELIEALPVKRYLKFRPHSHKQFIPIGTYDTTSLGHYVVSDETARRIDILLGPHAKAIFTAWAIKQTS